MEGSLYGLTFLEDNSEDPVLLYIGEFPPNEGGVVAWG